MGAICGICTGGFHANTMHLVLCEYKGGAVHADCCKNRCSKDKHGHATCPNAVGAFKKT